MANSMEVPQKLKIELPCDPAIPFLGIYLKEIKRGSRRDTCIPKYIVALFTIAKIGQLEILLSCPYIACMRCFFISEMNTQERI